MVTTPRSDRPFSWSRLALRAASRARLLAVAVALPLGMNACGYNTIQSYDEQAAQAKQNIDAQLQRRADLIPNLVNTVKGFAAQESDVLTAVTQARAGLVGALQKPGGSDPAELANANQQLTASLGRLSVTVEAYPELKSNENFLRARMKAIGSDRLSSSPRSE